MRIDLIWMRIAAYGFGSPLYNSKAFFSGVLISRLVGRAVVSLSHCLSHPSRMRFRTLLRAADATRITCCDFSVVGSAPYKAAVFACSSAASLPGTPTWADDNWYPAGDYKNAPDKLMAFHKRYPDLPGPPVRLPIWLDAALNDHADDGKPEPRG